MDSIENNGPVNYVGIRDVPVILHAPNTKFINISNNDSDQLIRVLELAVCPELKEILRLYVVPNIVDTTDDALRASLVEFALENFASLSQQSVDILSCVAIVPVNTTEAIFKRPVDTVSLDFMKYFFPDEYRTPVLKFYNRYCLKLAKLGMTTTMSEEFVLERIKSYSQSGHPPNEVGEKATGLLANFPPTIDPTIDMKLSQEYTSMQWLPAQAHGDVEEPKLYSAEQCRDRSYKSLVKYAMPLMKFDVSDKWRVAMGWDKPLQKSQLLAQLDGAVKAEDTTALRHLIMKRGTILIDYMPELQEREWIPDKGRLKYYRPSDTFFDDFSPLSPYLGTVAPEFKKPEYKRARGNILEEFLAKLGVNKEPSFSQVFIHPVFVQRTLPAFGRRMKFN